MTNRTDIVVLGYLVSLGDWRSNTTSSSTTYPLRVLSSSSNLIKFDDQDYNLRFFIVAITIKIMNSDKQSNSNTTGSANLAKARPALETNRDRPSEGDLARSTRYHKTTVQAKEGMDCEER
jgi:hypothetical protein